MKPNFYHLFVNKQAEKFKSRVIKEYEKLKLVNGKDGDKTENNAY